MAEVAGLSVGVIALASLFSACVDLCDRLDQGRNFIADYELSCSKISLLKMRLLRWVQSLNVEQLGREHSSFRAIWPEQLDVVAQGLCGMQKTFEKVISLQQKYELTQYCSSSQTSWPTSHPTDPASKARSTVRKSFGSWSSVGKRARWALHGKESFDRHIEDLTFLMDQLEAVKHNGPYKHSPGANMSAARGTSAERSKTHSSRSDFQQPSGSVPKKDFSSTADTADLEQIAKNFNGRIFVGKSVVHGTGIIGSVDGKDEEIPRQLFLADQTVHGISIIGSASAQAAVELYRAAPQGGERSHKGKYI